VGTTIHVEYFPGYLICLCQVENSVDHVSDAHDFPHWLQFVKRVSGIILMKWRIHDAGGYGVETDAFFCILDGETLDYGIQASRVIIETDAFTPAIG
jgi:hypothetical protein